MRFRLITTIIIFLSLISVVYAACYFGAGWNCTGCPTTQESSSLALGVRNGGAGWADCVYHDGSKCECRCSTDEKVYCADISSSTAQVCHISAEDYRCAPACACSGTSCNPSGNGTICDGCNWVAATASEICDGLDNDCDGLIDESLTRRCGTTGVGECSYGTQTCSVGNWQTCTGVVYPMEEVCDGKDNDCDGQIDNGFDCIKGSTNCENDCSFATQTNPCTGTTKPENATWNYGSTNAHYTQTWNGDSWQPTSKNFFYSETETECAWKCDTGYYYYNGECRSDTQTESCTGSLPINAVWNDGGREGTFQQLCSGGTCEPTSKNISYNETSGECNWSCAEGHHYDSGSCIANTKTIDCLLTDYNGSLPENAEWNDSGRNGTYQQQWVNSNWSPSLVEAFYSPITTVCAFDCEVESRYCELDTSKYCGKGRQPCEYGYWGECEIGTAIACSENQFCLNNACQFCGEGTKNCDLNLNTGCETDIMTSKINCGECGTVCLEDQTCINGECVGGSESDANVDEIDLCENKVCGENSVCNSSTGACVCLSGYNNCDGDLANGCETLGGCNVSDDDQTDDDSTDDEIIFCETNSDCNPWEICLDGECTENTGEKCNMDFDCLPDQECVSGKCRQLNCGEGYTTEANECVCEGTECGNACYSGEGVCCKGIWNPGINSCEYDLTDAITIVNKSGDSEAMNLISDSSTSYSRGNVAKGQAELNASLLRANLVISGKEENFEEEYQQILSAINSGDYSTADSLAKSTLEESEQESNQSIDVILIVLVIIVIIILGGIGFFGYKKFISNKEINEASYQDEL